MSDPIHAVEYHEGHVDHDHDALHSRVDMLETHPAECEARHAELAAENAALREELAAHLAEHESHDESDTTETETETETESEDVHTEGTTEAPGEERVAESRVEPDKIPERKHWYFHRLVGRKA